MKIKRILYLEDDFDEQQNLIRRLKGHEPTISKLGNVAFEIDDVSKESECRRLYKTNHYDLIILDLRLNEGNGLRFLRFIRKQDYTTPILVLSGEAKNPEWQEIGKYSNTYYYDKGIAFDGEVRSKLDQIIHCLIEGEHYFRKVHKDWFIPPELAFPLFEVDLFDSLVMSNARGDLLKYYRDPSKGFRGKGFWGYFSSILKVVSRYLDELDTTLFNNSEKIVFHNITNALTGVNSLGNMEQFLSLDPNYREHFIHQFQNFLLGCLIYSQFRELINSHLSVLYKDFIKKIPIDDYTLEKLFSTSWFITTMFHDIAYPVQLQHMISQKHYEDIYCYRFSPTIFSPENVYIREGIETCLDSIVCDYWSNRVNKELFALLLRHEFLNKNHGIHSAISIRNLIRHNTENEGFLSLFSPVFSAIALHDWSVWSNAKQVKNVIGSSGNSGVTYDLDFLGNLEKNLFLHILLIVDNLQGWGRSKNGKPFYRSVHLELVKIDTDINNPNKLLIELNVRKNLRQKTATSDYNEILKQMSTLSSFLGTQGVPISVKLNQGLEGVTSKTYEFDK